MRKIEDSTIKLMIFFKKLIDLAKIGHVFENSSDFLPPQRNFKQWLLTAFCKASRTLPAPENRPDAQKIRRILCAYR
jgi:hypothetical protein